MRKDNTLVMVLISFGLLILSMLVAISFGSVNLTFAEIVDALVAGLIDKHSGSLSERIILELRTPRVALAAMCGVGLALSGAILQSVTRNPLADPFLFGISSGAVLGAVIAIGFNNTLAQGGSLSISAAAFVGALAAVSVIIAVGRNGQIERLILAGVAISFLFGSIANLLLYFSQANVIQSVLFWSLGSFARASWAELTLPFVAVTVALFVAHLLQRHLQALMAGDESAHTQGVAVVPLRLGMLLLTALVTAALVAQCGGIGFVGLVVPHISRLLIGVGGRFALVVTALLGGLLMVWVDLLSRWLLPQQELPIGVMTAIIGSLFFIGVLIRKRV